MSTYDPLVKIPTGSITEVLRLDNLFAISTFDSHFSYDRNVMLPPNPYLDTLTPKSDGLTGGTFGRCLDPQDKSLTNRFNALERGSRETPGPLLPHKFIGRSLPHERGPSSGNTRAMILDCPASRTMFCYDSLERLKHPTLMS